jgi:Mitochondrial import 2
MHLAFCLFPLIVNVIHSFIMAASEGSMSGGYLDEKMADPIQRSTLLQQHLQRQPYAHLIRAHGYAGGIDDDDVDDDEEQKHKSKTRRKRAHGRRRNRYDDNNYDEDDDDTLSVTTYDSEEEARLAQEEWEESIGQLNLALQVMVLPFFGKWLGRKMSYWRE